MGAADCRSLCNHQNGLINNQSLVVKQFTQEERLDFVDNLNPYFEEEYEENQKQKQKQESEQNYIQRNIDGSEILSNEQTKSFENLQLTLQLKDLLKQFDEQIDENPKLWKYTGTLQEFSNQFGTAYLWNKSLEQADASKQKKKSQQENKLQKFSLLSSRLQILFSDKKQPTKIIGYFRGDVSKGYARCQSGIFIRDMGLIYKGKLLNSLAHGRGRFQNRKLGYTYEGYWSQDYPHSPIEAAKETISFENDYQQGQPVEQYVGQFRYGKRQGNGTLTSDKTPKHQKFQYIGEFKSGKFDGVGKLQIQGKFESECTVYKGEFKAGKKDGQGQWEGNGQVYNGDWKDNQKHGKGQFTFTNSGVKYIGDFVEDQFSGEGTVGKNGEIITKGIWSRGKCVLKV